MFDENFVLYNSFITFGNLTLEESAGTRLLVTSDLVTFTKEILNGKLHFLCSVASS